eukprot:s3767_g11.t1
MLKQPEPWQFELKLEPLLQCHRMTAVSGLLSYAKPRVERDFVAGDFVSYWRTQKYMRGVRLIGGRWYGTGIVMGKVGRNVLVFHRQNMFNVSPEHLRHASETERAVAQSDGRELLGIKDLVAEGRNLLGSQYVDLTQQSGPPNPADAVPDFDQVRESPDQWYEQEGVLVRVHNKLRVGKFMPEANDPFIAGRQLADWRMTRIKDSDFQLVEKPWSSDSSTACAPLRARPWLGETHFRLEVSESASPSSSPEQASIFDDEPAENSKEPSQERSHAAPSTDEVSESSSSKVVDNTGGTSKTSSSTSYGPIRHRSFGSGRGDQLIRPPALVQDDLQEILEEFQQHGSKRSHSPSQSESPGHKCARTNQYDESMLVEVLMAGHCKAQDHGETSTECGDNHLIEALMAEHHDCVESLVASFLQKKLQQELPHSNNPPALQEKIDDAKVTEFVHTLQNEKKAIPVLPPAQAQRIRKTQPDRIMSSRFVITEKKEDNSSRTKARWCLRGHHDPDLVEKVLSGKCHSPTLSQLSRSVILQLIVSHRWLLNLGDIKGAFLEADISQQTSEKPVYAELPPGGVPGIPKGSLVQVLGNIYGANDAPHNWYVEFDHVALQAGFKRSKLDNCLYFCHGNDGRLQGVLGAHVDDTITGGSGDRYDAAIRFLKERFPFRKWRVGEGEVLGIFCLAGSEWCTGVDLVTEQARLSRADIFVTAGLSKTDRAASSCCESSCPQMQTTEGSRGTVEDSEGDCGAILRIVVKLLCELLDRMNAHGRVPGDDELLFTEGIVGSMADSSKRLRASEEDACFEGYECLGTPRAKQIHLDAPAGSQQPLAPNSKTGLKLPPRVTDLKDWGTTICKLPKVASLQLSHDDMVKDTKKYGSYLHWVLAHGANRGGRLEDLCLYLQAIDYDHMHPASSEAGTQEVRERKKDSA